MTVLGDGQRLQVITTIEKQKGQTEIIDHDFVTGTAAGQCCNVTRLASESMQEIHDADTALESAMIHAVE